MTQSKRLWICIGLMVASCGKHSQPAKGGEPAGGGEPAKSTGSAAGAAPGSSWSAPPLDATIQNKVHGVPFTLAVPKAWKFVGMGSETEADPAAIVKKWQPGAPGHLGGPSVMISYLATPATDLAGFVQRSTFDPDMYVLTKKAALADGFVVAFHKKDNGILVVELMRTKGDAHVMCRASQSANGGVSDPDAVLGWLEKLCDSLTLP